jgi:hypothetical protein
MSPRTNDLRQAFQNNVDTLYEHGLDPAVGSATIPVVAALASTVCNADKDKDSADYQVVKDFMHECVFEPIAEIVAKLPKRKHVTPKQAEEGLRELIGTGKSGYKGSKIVRIDNAGQAMGYADESFRGRGQKNALPNLIRVELVNQLVIIADAHGFKLPVPPSPASGKTWLEVIKDKQELPNGEWGLTAFLSGREFFEEVRELCTEGFQDATRPKWLKTDIGKLVQNAAQGKNDTAKYNPANFAKDLEAVLLWIVDRIPEPDHRQGVIEFLGLGEKRGLSLKAREKRAAQEFGYENSKRFVNDGKRGRIIHFVRDQFVVLAGEMDYWPVTVDKDSL